jgi:hypothetical protein
MTIIRDTCLALTFITFNQALISTSVINFRMQLNKIDNFSRIVVKGNTLLSTIYSLYGVIAFAFVVIALFKFILLGYILLLQLIISTYFLFRMKSEYIKKIDLTIKFPHITFTKTVYNLLYSPILHLIMAVIFGFISLIILK